MELIVKGNNVCYPDGGVVVHPTVMFDKDTGTLHCWGDKDYVEMKYKTWCLADTTGLISKDLVLFTFSDSEPEFACEQINKMVSTTGYARLFFKRYVLMEQ